MELVAENGFVVSIPIGCKMKIGRGPELAIFDKTVARDQVLVELKGCREEISSTENKPALYQLSIEVLGPNPVCVVHIGRSGGGKQEVFLKKGEKDTMVPGDKISLSLSHPQFLTAKEGEDVKGGLRSSTAEMPESLGEDGLLQKWNDRKNMKKARQDASQAEASSSDASKNIYAPQKDEDITANEEVGIAQAVARRQRWALERQKRQEQEVQDKPAKDVEKTSALQHDVHEFKDDVVDIRSIDPVKEFGFLVEGSEFDRYKDSHHSDKRRWVWPVPSENAEFASDDDDDDEDRHTPKRVRKARQEEDDEEWRGDDQQEEVTIARSKDRKPGTKVNLRSNVPSSSKNRGIPGRSKKPGGSKKYERKDLEEDEDEADETLGGFIVDDEEDLTDEGDDADSSEEELSEDDEIEEDEDSDSQELPREATKKRQEKPLCKYGKKCYRKSSDHLAQFRHQ